MTLLLLGGSRVGIAKDAVCAALEAGFLQVHDVVSRVLSR
eukprot:CAMPEP_0197642674 /NCGR_PEP_ID=MMETSP1338-20131121/16263_1 /TAXON_ID=43686 ORGANISM="Pelagodinium beii, Strain RCC1491" /NCGR_SAMPLE_ID=MMETSP1338 /ASSEMBLY_ACC=CAM_ASM_000754 /LENGTH=39 /DNA_ID= /DNA_START= /DNA_END= /DNA_ORIENTATION=